MQIVIDGAAGTVSVSDESDFTSLSGRVAGGPEMADRVLARGRVDADHLWIEVGYLKELASVGEDAERSAKFDSMIAYARSKGWVNDSDEVRAHLV